MTFSEALVSTHRIVLLGANGLLGRAITALADASTNFVPLSHRDLELTDANAVERMLKANSGATVINCAAYTAVDKAEREADRAMLINGAAVGVLAAACENNGCRLIHISTDAVFDGRKREPYQPDDKPNPISVYGRSKLAGEEAILNSRLQNWVIVRTAWLFGDGRCFPRTILERVRAGYPISVVTDQFGSPTYAADAASPILDLAMGDFRGITHVVNEGVASWHELATWSVQLAGMHLFVQKATTNAYAIANPGLAPRPAYTALDTSSLNSIVGYRLPNWQDALRRAMPFVIRRASQTA